MIEFDVITHLAFQEVECLVVENSHLRRTELDLLSTQTRLKCQSHAVFCHKDWFLEPTSGRGMSAKNQQDAVEEENNQNEFAQI